MKPLIHVCLVAALLCGCKREQKTPPTTTPAAPAPRTPEEAKGPGAPPSAGTLAAKTRAVEQALKHRKQGKTLGKMVRWRKLAAFLPDKFGAYKATGPARGKNYKRDKMETASAKRYYAAPKKDLTLELNDLSVNPMLRASIAVARKMKLNTPGGYMEHGLRVGQLPANRGWNYSEQKKMGAGKLTVLVGGRYLVQVTLKGAQDPDEVIKTFEQLDLAALPALKAD